MRVLVTGAGGQLGRDVCRELERRGIDYRGLSSGQMNVSDAQAVRSAAGAYRPDAVIHCGAYTKVDRAEDEPEKCWRVNADGTRNVALTCRETGAKLVYISTDYVFSGAGQTPYEVTDGVGPLNVYGASKLAGELAVRTLAPASFIVRSSWAFGADGGNFVKTMLRLAERQDQLSVVCDQVGSPTYTADLAALTCDMIGTEKYGVYHATNEGFCSWAEFAAEIFRLCGRRTKVLPVPTEGYPTRAVRPRNSRLSKDSLERAGFHRLPDWHDALERFIRSMGAGA